MKKWLVFLVTLLATITLAACSDNGASGTNESGETIELDFWSVQGEKDSGPMEMLVDKYNESQDKVHVNFLGNQDDQKQLTAISGGNAPDIAFIYWNLVGPWAAAGALEPLNTFIEEDGFNLDSLIPAATNRMSIDGQQFGMPMTMSMASKLFYNKQALADAGYTEPPKTMEELLEYSKALTIEENGELTQIGFIPDYPWIDNVFWPIMFGGDFYDEETGEVTPNREENVQAIAYQKEFYNEFGVDAINTIRSGMGAWETPQDPLITGKLAMLIGWENNFRDYRGEDGSIGVAPFPYPEDRPDLEGSGMVSPTALYVPKNAEHKDEAWQFMKFLLDEENQIDFAIEYGNIPVVKAALDNPRLTENEDVKIMWGFYEAAKSDNLKGFPNSVYINEYLQALNEETEQVLRGNLSAQEAMDNVKEKIQPLADKESSK
ncbi:ABC transporter substrate-binding protein [Oceanobacillus arenosus]|uniref:ABC transporter substrate-binding protein n=1 Tax=Oceanobacillus arenosus TaxID=1229153 RepID=A0A3D8Q471_9BACI|nr:ABC transporter substrate-binding protein [Oceanobacillus arenosus]RDW22195.1 ABC transporter substrate-binding protein [Oceanobacillus arenosus]